MLFNIHLPLSQYAGSDSRSNQKQLNTSILHKAPTYLTTYLLLLYHSLLLFEIKVLTHTES